MRAIRLAGVTVGYQGRPAILHDVDLEVEAGQSVAIMGPSGGGKSTLLKTVAGLVAPRSGEVQVLGRTQPQRPPRGSVGYVPQRLGLVRHTSVIDNVLHGSLHQTTWWQNAIHRAPAGAMERAAAAIDAMDLRAHAHEPIHRLSGGQQRRVAVARTLVQRPKVLLADEFLGELDPGTASMVASTVRRLQEEHGTAVLMVEHRLDQALDIADRIFHLEAGRLTEVPRG